ncbi:MAG: hypothetical protein IT438_07945 [Phycisphaerales bacterium]|nr:hypothetical protein [Phycisphaerales bacterium]
MPDTPPTTDPTPDLAEARKLAAEIRAERDTLHALYTAGISDLEVGIALVKHRLAAHDEPGAGAPPDIASIVKDLRATRPALFRSSPATPPSASRPASATLAHAPDHDPRGDLARAADAARAAGDPGSLARYLQLRRAAAD